MLNYRINAVGGQPLSIRLPPAPNIIVPPLPARPYPYNSVDRWGLAYTPRLARRAPGTPWSPLITNLPYYGVKQQLVQQISEREVNIIVAPTGSGKTMTTPAIMYEASLAREPNCFGVPLKCLISVPTSQQADACYMRMTEIYADTPITIGKFHGAERSYPSAYQTEPVRCPILTGSESVAVVTPFIALKILQRAQHITHIVIDEAHEMNNLNHELLYQALIEVQQRGSRLIIMSATLSPAEINHLTTWIRHRSTLPPVVYDATPYVQSPHRVYQGCITPDPNEGAYLARLLANVRLDHQRREATAAMQRQRNQQQLAVQRQNRAGVAPGQDLLVVSQPPTTIIQGNRAVMVVKEWMLMVKNTTPDENMLSRRVCMVFLAGNAEILEMRNMLMNCPEMMHDVDNVPIFNILRASAADKVDLDLLKGDDYPNMGRVVLTTNLLESGVTINNVELVVDTAIRRVQRTHQRNGLVQLEVVWVDGNEMKQRAGRTGRTGDGYAILLATETERDEILVNSNFEAKLHRSTTPTAIMSRIGVPQSSLFPPPAGLLFQIHADLATTGCIRVVPANPQVDELDKSFLSLVTTEFFHFFGDDRLPRLILYGHSGGFLAHAVALAAALYVENFGLRMPTAQPNARRDDEGAGRHDPWYSLNHWMTLAPASAEIGAEKITLASIIVQALYDKEHSRDPAHTVYFNNDRRRWQLNPSLIEEIVTMASRIQSALQMLGLLRAPQFGIAGESIFEAQNNRFIAVLPWAGNANDLKDPAIPQNPPACILVLNQQGTYRFHAALLACFGDRVLPNAGPERCRATIIGKEPNEYVGKIESESYFRMANELATYYKVYSVGGAYNKALLTPCIPLEYLLFGNVHATSIIPYEGMLRISTNSVNTITLTSENIPDLVVICSYRQVMHGIAWNTLHNNPAMVQQAWEIIDRAIVFCRDPNLLPFISRVP